MFPSDAPPFLNDIFQTIIKPRSNFKVFMQTLRLLLPAIIPSWRFFDWIAASPRIEFVLLQHLEDTLESWQELRPRPATLSPHQIIARLLWNPRWNESLFLVACAERLLENPTEHSRREILMRIKHDLETSGITAPYVQFRLVLVSREGAELKREIAYLSPPAAWTSI